MKTRDRIRFTADNLFPMNTPAFLRSSLVLLFLATSALTVRANDADTIAAVKAADDERVAALIKVDVAALDHILSEQLRYAHSSGAVDTKASYRDSVATHRSVYGSVEYLQRDFIPAAPGIVLMEGRVLIKAGNSVQQNLLDLNYLAVWRLEGGQWRFLAWQSCRNVPPPPAAK
jgi:Domain of unknown function (DUF4440)